MTGDTQKLLVDADAAKLCRDLAHFVAASRGSMLADEAKAWDAIRALTPQPEGEAIPVDDYLTRALLSEPETREAFFEEMALDKDTELRAHLQWLESENERLRAALRGLVDAAKALGLEETR